MWEMLMSSLGSLVTVCAVIVVYVITSRRVNTASGLAPKVSTRTLAEVADTRNALHAAGATYEDIARHGRTETPEQLMARLDRRAVLDWEADWEKLAGEPWPDGELAKRRARAAKESETITMQNAHAAMEAAMEAEKAAQECVSEYDGFAQAYLLAVKRDGMGVPVVPLGRGGIIRPPSGFIPDPNGKWLIVDPGDTWESIAAQFGNTPLELSQANPDMNPATIQPGHILRRPKYRTIPKDDIPPSIRRTMY